MKAKLNIPKIEKFNASVRDKDYMGSTMAVTTDGQHLVDLRIYSPRKGSSYYAAIWINAAAKGFYLKGTGQAGGHGYHKASAATSEAMTNAGVELSEAIGGVGDTAMREAVEAIAKVAGGGRKFIIVETHP